MPLGLSPGAGTPTAGDWDRMEAAGASWVRLDFAWSAIEPTDDAFRWRRTDALVDAATGHGLDVIALLTYAPDWANGGYPDNKYPPTEAHAVSWEQFAYETARRYLPMGVDTFEMWNEPNHAGFWKPGPDPAAYTQRVLKPGASGIRRAAAESGVEATVLTGGAAPAVTGTNLSPGDHLRGVYAAGGRDAFDVVAHHPYTWPWPVTEPGGWNSFTQMDTELYPTMVAHGDADKEIWATEIGWPSRSPGEGPVYPRSDTSRFVTHRMQADRLTEAVDAYAGKPYAGVLLWYGLRDRGVDQRDPEQSFGLLHHDGRRKPAYGAFTKAAGQ